MTCAKRVKNIEFLADPTAGEVRIGCTALLAASFVSAVVDRLSRRYPRIVFHLVTGYVETLHRELSERNVDLLIARRFGPIADERLDFEFLFDDSYVVAAGAQNPWVRRRRIELAELVNESWVLPPPGSVIGSIAMEAFRASGLDYPRTTVVTDSPQVRISLLATGRFVTIFPASALRFPARRSEIKVLPVELPMARRAKRNRHPEEPHAQPRRAAFHRLRPRSRQAAGEAKMIRRHVCWRAGFEPSSDAGTICGTATQDRIEMLASVNGAERTRFSPRAATSRRPTSSGRLAASGWDFARAIVVNGLRQLLEFGSR